ncbi:MAG TPA: transketolase [Gemmatimonadaceae bacterium]|nr:transketolase [Gemmatimonadaceae bacterium]
MTSSETTVATSLDELCINTVRTLAMDAVQKAESGHPGAPMALAPLAYLLFTRHLKHNPADPTWPDRDRFVLSNGHASMLLYSVLYLTGYDLSLDEIKNFRQWGSKTPGHPEHGHTPGVETTTGPLGQGFGNAVGMAVAEAQLAATFNKTDNHIVDHFTWFICSDGDLMEGLSHEAASFAGHQRLGRLIGFYDDNNITIDGSTDLAYSDDVARRFDGYGWHVHRVDDVNDLAVLESAIAACKAETDRPSLVIVKTHIGYGSPNRQDSAKAHGEALGAEEVDLTKKNLGWPTLEKFWVPEEALTHWRTTRERGAAAHDQWRRQLIAYAKAYPNEAKEFSRRVVQRELPAGWQSSLPTFTKENGSVATRAASGTVLNAIGLKIPELFGGSADLTPSNNTLIKDAGVFSAANRTGRYVHYGVREHAMASMMSGIALHGGLIPYGGTFLIFSDYMRPSVRLAALMGVHVVYVYTHDSIGLGEDGPTHQPIEHLSALRAIPNMTLIRPADSAEVVEAWRIALTHKTGPVALALTRQKLAFIDRAALGSKPEDAARGGYVIAGADANDVAILSSGSEVAIALKAREQLAAEGIQARVVSMPCHEIFAHMPIEYRNSVLPPNVKRVAIEAAHPMSWYRWVGIDGAVVGLERFGASAKYEDIYKHLGITAEAVVLAVKRVLGR